MPREFRSKEAQAYRHLYNTALWQAIRKEQLENEPYCKFCSEEGKTVIATIVDHVVPHKGDPHLFFYGKKQSLCKPHHDKSKQEIEHKGYRTGFDDDGNPTDPNHPWYVERDNSA